jgi:hypothetical protein
VLVHATAGKDAPTGVVSPADQNLIDACAAIDSAALVDYPNQSFIDPAPSVNPTVVIDSTYR